MASPYSAAPIQFVGAAPANRSDERITWALVAVVLVLLAGGAGWLIAANSQPSWGDLDSSARLAEREGAADGRVHGFGQGAKLGRREARASSKVETLSSSKQAWSRGWQSGFEQGREQARAKRNGGSLYSMGTGAYPEAGYDDVELQADSLLGDIALQGGNTLDTPYGGVGVAASSLSDLYRGGSSAGY